jgi:hypothetical protein
MFKPLGKGGLFLPSSIALCALYPGVAMAQKKPWDVDRFAQCTKLTSGELDPLVTIATGACGDFVKVEKVSGELDNVTVDTVATYSRGPKTEQVWVGVLVLKIGYQRNATVVGGNAAGGFSGFDKMTALLDGKVEEIALSDMNREVRGCGTMGRGFLQVTTCGYNEYVAAPVTDDLLAKLRRADRPSGAKLRVKLFSTSGETFEAELFPAEVIAANKVAARK